MNFIWGLIAGIVVATVVCVVWMKMVKKPTPLDSDASNGARRDLMAEAKEKHAEIMVKLGEYLKDKTEVTNDEVQNFLGVSDASAERYLDELESQGKLTQIGKTGVSTHYKVNPVR